MDFTQNVVNEGLAIENQPSDGNFTSENVSINFQSDGNFETDANEQESVTESPIKFFPTEE